MPNEMTPLEAAEILLPCNLEQLNERILNLGVGIAQMSEQDSIRVHKSFLVSVLGYMEELLAVRNKIAAGEYKPVIHAHWKEVEPGHDVLYECSNCGRIISTSWGCCEDEDTKGCNGCDPTEEWLCCPTCHALMDGKDDSHAS